MAEEKNQTLDIFVDRAKTSLEGKALIGVAGGILLFFL